MSVDQICAIVLKYEEKGWTDKTLQCCADAGITKIVMADRDGIGNMSKALNKAGFAGANSMIDGNSVKGYISSIRSAAARPNKWMAETEYTLETVLCEYIWFLTNVSFDPETPLALMAAFGDHTAAVHPVHQSDHLHLRSCGETPQDVPFVEFTAPMFSTRAASVIGPADENMPYWGMDLDWSYRAKQAGFNLKVSPARVQHVYLRSMKKKEPITLLREQMRLIYHAPTEIALMAKYGIEWQTKLWPR